MTPTQARTYLRLVKATGGSALTILNLLRPDPGVWAGLEDVSDDAAVMLAEEVRERLEDSR